jgi:hypothetical protein
MKPAQKGQSIWVEDKMTTIEQMTPEEFQKAREKAIKRLQKQVTQKDVLKEKRARYAHTDYEKHKEKRLTKMHERSVVKKEEVSDAHKDYAMRKKDQIATYKHQHYLDTKKETLTRAKQNYQKNKEKKRLQYIERKKTLTPEQKAAKIAYDHQHHIDNKEEKALYDHNYYLKNKEKLLKYFWNHYRNTREERLVHQHRYYLENPEVAKTNNALYRARLANAEGSYTPEEFRLKCRQYEDVCAYCGRKLSLGPDHATPLSRGGDNYIENIIPVCEFCNKSKHDKTLQEFLATHTQEEQEEILTRIYLADHPEERLREDN